MNSRLWIIATLTFPKLTTFSNVFQKTRGEAKTNGGSSTICVQERHKQKGVQGCCNIEQKKLSGSKD